MMFLEKFPAFKKITKESFDQQRRRIILDREKRLSFLVEKRIHTQDSKKKSFDRYAEAQIEIKRAQKSIGKPQLEKIWLNYMHSMMRWNLTSKKFSTPMKYGVWKLILCSFTYQSQKNPIP